MGLGGFGEDGVQLGEDLFDAHGVHLAGCVVALFDDGLEVAASDLGGKLVSDNLAGAALLLDPGFAGERDPHGLDVDVEADVDCVGVARGDGYDVCLPAAV